MKPAPNTITRVRDTGRKAFERCNGMPKIDYAYQSCCLPHGGSCCSPPYQQRFRDIAEEYLAKEVGRASLAEASVFGAFLLSACFAVAHCGLALLRMLESFDLH